MTICHRIVSNQKQSAATTTIMSSPIMTDAEAEGCAIASAEASTDQPSADQPTTPMDPWIEAFPPAESAITGEAIRTNLSYVRSRLLQPQPTEATDPVGRVALGPIPISLGLAEPSTTDTRPPGINTMDEPPHGQRGSVQAVA